MKLTVRQLHLDVEERFKTMTLRVERCERHYDHLHDRCDRILLNLDALRKETREEFREIRSDMQVMKDDMQVIKGDMHVMKSDMRLLQSGLRPVITKLNTVIEYLEDFAGTATGKFAYIDHRLDELEKAE